MLLYKNVHPQSSEGAPGDDCRPDQDRKRGTDEMKDEIPFMETTQAAATLSPRLESRAPFDAKILLGNG